MQFRYVVPQTTSANAHLIYANNRERTVCGRVVLKSWRINDSYQGSVCPRCMTELKARQLRDSANAIR